jgi:hypothetical protein
MKFLLVKIIIIAFLGLYKADIPTHCLKTQVIGEWEFKASKPVKKSLHDLYDLKCGHTLPSHESTSYKINVDLATFTETFKVEFKNIDDIVYKKDSTISSDLVTYNN